MHSILSPAWIMYSYISYFSYCWNQMLGKQIVWESASIYLMNWENWVHCGGECMYQSSWPQEHVARNPQVWAEKEAENRACWCSAGFLFSFHTQFETQVHGEMLTIFKEMPAIFKVVISYSVMHLWKHTHRHMQVILKINQIDNENKPF